MAEQWNSVGVAGHQELRRWALCPSDRTVFLLSTARVSIAASVYSPANMYQSLQYRSVYCTISSELQNSWALGQLDPQILKDKLPQSTIHQQTATHYWHQLNASLTNCTEWHSLWILDHKIPQGCKIAPMQLPLPWVPASIFTDMRRLCRRAFWTVGKGMVEPAETIRNSHQVHYVNKCIHLYIHAYTYICMYVCIYHYTILYIYTCLYKYVNVNH